MGELPTTAINEIAAIFDNYFVEIRRTGHMPTAIAMSTDEAIRCGLRNAITLLGHPIIRKDDLPIGVAQVRTRDGSIYEARLPVTFTED